MNYMNAIYAGKWKKSKLSSLINFGFNLALETLYARHIKCVDLVYLKYNNTWKTAKLI